MVFKVRRSLRRVGIFLVGFGMFIPAGIAVVLYAGEKFAGFGLIGFGAFFLLILLLTTLAPRSRYRIGPGELVLKKGFSSRRIPFTDISGSRVILEAEANSIITEYMSQAMASEVNLDIRGWLSSNRKYGHFVKYCTVPIIQSKRTSGNSFNIVDFAGKSSGSFVILRESSGAEQLLSPTDPGAFHRALLPNIRVTAQIGADYPYRSQLAFETGRPSDNRKKLLRMNLITGIVLVAAIAIFFAFRDTGTNAVDSLAAPPAPQPVEFVEATGWVDGDTYLTRIERPNMAATVKDPEQRKKLMRDAIYSSYHFDIIDGMTSDYYSRFSLDPVATTRERVWDKMLTYFQTLTPVLRSEEFNVDITTITIEIEVSVEGMHTAVDRLIEGTLGEKP